MPLMVKLHHSRKSLVLYSKFLIMMSDLITMEMELRFQFHSQPHGFLRQYECGDLLVHIEAGIIRIPGGCLEKLPGEEEPFG